MNLSHPQSPLVTLTVHSPRGQQRPVVAEGQAAHSVSVPCKLQHSAACLLESLLTNLHICL